MYVGNVPYNCSCAGEQVRRAMEREREKEMMREEKRGDGERKEGRKGKGEEGRKSALSVNFLLQLVIDIVVASGRRYQGSILCPACSEICHVSPPNSEELHASTLVPCI